MNKAVSRLWSCVCFILLLNSNLTSQEKNSFLMLTEMSVELSPESFEEEQFPPEAWQKFTDFEGTGWLRGEVGSIVPGFVGAGAVFDAPPGGGNFVAYASWATGDADGVFQTGQPTDQWLITPQIFDVGEGDSLKFHLRYFAQRIDTLDVLISESDNDTSAFDIKIASLAFSDSSSNDWLDYGFALTDFVGIGSDIYIAFREHVSNTAEEGDALFLDLVEVTSLVNSVESVTGPVSGFQLHQNYPNPFNPTTFITFSLPRRSDVTLKVYNLMGQLAASLIDRESYPQGEHKVPFAAGDLPTGIYYYKVDAGEFTKVKKMILIK